MTSASRATQRFISLIQFDFSSIQLSATEKHTFIRVIYKIQVYKKTIVLVDKIIIDYKCLSFSNALTANAQRVRVNQRKDMDERLQLHVVG